jgi:hypothetical protein
VQLEDISAANAINEQCEQYNECGGYTTYFLNQGKGVFQVEYKLGLNKFCPQANAANRNTIKKMFDLFDAPWTPAGSRPQFATAAPGRARALTHEVVSVPRIST